MNQDGGDGGIDSAAESAYGATVADLRSNGCYRFLNEGGAAPFRFGFANAEEKIAEEFRAAFGVVYLNVELDGINFSLWIFESGDGVVRVARRAEAARKFADVVAVAIPDAEGFGDAGKERGCGGALFAMDFEVSAAIFAAGGFFHF